MSKQQREISPFGSGKKAKQKGNQRYYTHPPFYRGGVVSAFPFCFPFASCAFLRISLS